MPISRSVPSQPVVCANAEVTFVVLSLGTITYDWSDQRLEAFCRNHPQDSCMCSLARGTREGMDLDYGVTLGFMFLQLS